jgi:hypothetical protein
MSLGNFNLVWTFLANNFKALPLRTLFSYGMSLGTQQQVLRALTVERIIDPVLKTQGITKPELKNGKNEMLVTWLFSLIGLTRITKFAVKLVLWLPKLVLTLFVLSLTSIDVSYFQSLVSWFTWGFSNSLTLFFSTIWALIVYVYKTGDILNLNFLRNISEPLNLESLFKNKGTKEVKEIISEISNEEHNSNKTTWSSSYKNLIRVGALFVLQVTIKYFLDTTIVSEYLKEHPWLDKVGDLFRWTSKFGKDINNVLVENLPLVGRVENAASTLIGGVLGYTYYGYDKAIATPVKWGWNTASSSINYIRSWFSYSEETLAELKRLKEENDSLKDKTLRRRWSLSSLNSGIRNWRSGTQVANKNAKPRVNTGDLNENPLPSGTSAWGRNNNSVPGTPISPSDNTNNLNAEPALSTVQEEAETATPRSRSNPGTVGSSLLSGNSFVLLLGVSKEEEGSTVVSTIKLLGLTVEEEPTDEEAAGLTGLSPWPKYLLIPDEPLGVLGSIRSVPALALALWKRPAIEL